MPFTPLILSTDVKGPFCERYSSILFAIVGPMPGNASSSLAVAVLILFYYHAITLQDFRES